MLHRGSTSLSKSGDVFSRGTRDPGDDGCGGLQVTWRVEQFLTDGTDVVVGAAVDFGKYRNDALAECFDQRHRSAFEIAEENNEIEIAYGVPIGIPLKNAGKAQGARRGAVFEEVTLWAVADQVENEGSLRTLEIRAELRDAIDAFVFHIQTTDVAKLEGMAQLFDLAGSGGWSDWTLNHLDALGWDARQTVTDNVAKKEVYTEETIKKVARAQEEGFGCFRVAVEDEDAAGGSVVRAEVGSGPRKMVESDTVRARFGHLAQLSGDRSERIGRRNAEAMDPVMRSLGVFEVDDEVAEDAELVIELIMKL